MGVIARDYRVEGFGILLDENCILTQYYPLIPYKTKLIDNLISNNHMTKCDCAGLTDAELMQMGMTNDTLIRLFRSFLKLYDIDASKLKELDKEAMPESRRKALSALYLLPGVRLNRAMLYFESGYVSLQAIASATSEEMIEKTTKTIAAKQMLCKPPFPKEAKTHIAVAKVFTEYSVQ